MYQDYKLKHNGSEVSHTDYVRNIFTSIQIMRFLLFFNNSKGQKWTLQVKYNKHKCEKHNKGVCNLLIQSL